MQADTEQPVSGAARNQSTVGDELPADELLIPSLEEGVTLLDIEGERGVTVFQAVVLDHLLLSEGPAFWVDTHGHAMTTTLARLAPSRRVLDRIHVARGFTPYKHYSAVRELPEVADRQICEENAVAPSVVVAPALDAQYRDADTLSESQARTLQARTLARLQASADAYDAPVVVTRTTEDEFTAPIETTADHRLRCERTRFGPRFVGADHETLVYPVGDDAYQTTFAYWRHVLTARAEQVGIQTNATPETGAPTSGSGRSGATAQPTAVTSPDPMRDAWLGAAGGR